ncbi:hypothetical protein NSP_41700 [Nodularia spumigena CCY9414]|nr:hypothetical protein NSP_41700 [Nodularia spumigena CCY9414]
MALPKPRLKSMTGSYRRCDRPSNLQAIIYWKNMQHQAEV